MCNGKPHDVFESVGMMVKGCVALALDLRVLAQHLKEQEAAQNAQ